MYKDNGKRQFSKIKEDYLKKPILFQLIKPALIQFNSIQFYYSHFTKYLHYISSQIYENRTIGHQGPVA